MMSVLEYANDMNKDVKEIIEMCKKLGIAISNENDMLDDDAIVELDNAFQNEELEDKTDALAEQDEEIIKKLEEDDYYDEVVDTLIDKKDTIYSSEPAPLKKKKNKNKQKEYHLQILS